MGSPLSPVLANIHGILRRNGIRIYFWGSDLLSRPSIELNMIWEPIKRLDEKKVPKIHSELSSRTHSITVIGIGSLISKETIIWRLQVQFWLKASNNTGILNTCTRLWLMESELVTPMDSIKGHNSKFREGSQVWQKPEEGQKTYRPKRCGNNNKDEDNSPKTL